MSVVIVVTAFPAPERRAEVNAAFEAAIIPRSRRDRSIARVRPWPGLVSALEGKLSSPLDAHVLVPHPAGNARKGAL